MDIIGEQMENRLLFIACRSYIYTHVQLHLL